VGLIFHTEKWLVPTLLYISITLWLLFRHVPIQIISRSPQTPQEPEINGRPIFSAWNSTAVPISEKIPEKYRTYTGAAIVLIVILAVTFGSPQTEQNSYKNRGVSLFGLCVFYGLLYATSADRKWIVWRTVLVGLLCQFVLALFVLRTKVGYDIFDFVSFLARSLLGFANAGTAFLTSPSIPNTRSSHQIQVLTLDSVVLYCGYPRDHIFHRDRPASLLLRHLAMGRH
jgi:concentrative nucleoside transporter, CNT family